MLGQGLEHGLSVGDAVDFVPIMLQLRAQYAAQVVLVIGHEDLFGFDHGPECSAARTAVQRCFGGAQLAALRRCSAARMTVARCFRARSYAKTAVA